MDDVLASQYQAMNEDFFRGDPAEYLTTRLTTLLHLAANRTEVIESLQSGIDALGVFVQNPSATMDDDELQRHVAIDATMLAHLAIETLLRLLLGLASGDPCPPLTVASQREQIKATVKERFLSDEHLESLRVEVGQLALGIMSNASEELIAKRDECTQLVRDLARVWLDDAELYNSLKHGLAGVPGNAQLLIGPLASNGPSFSYLTRSNVDEGVRWSTRIHYVDIKEAIGAIMVSTTLISNIWSLARFRYVGGARPDGFAIPTPTSLRQMGSGERSIYRFEWHRVLTTRPPKRPKKR